MKLLQILSAISRIIVGLLLLLTASPNLYTKLKILESFVPLFVPLGLLLLLSVLVFPFLTPKLKISRVFRRFLWPVSLLCMAIVCWMAVSFTAIILVGRGSTPPAGATVVVLGEGSYKGVPDFNQLIGITAAGNYLRTHPSAMCIASGGVTTDISPADATAIRDVLISQYQISSDRIFVENQSRTTHENMLYSKKIIQAHGLSRNIAVAAPAFHLLRAEMIARRMGLVPYGLPGKVYPQQQWPNYVRELFAFPKSFLLD